MLLAQIAANTSFQAATLNDLPHFNELKIEHVGQRLAYKLRFGSKTRIESPYREIGFLHDARQPSGSNPAFPKFLRRNFDDSLMRSLFSAFFVSHLRELPKPMCRWLTRPDFAVHSLFNRGCTEGARDAAKDA